MTVSDVSGILSLKNVIRQRAMIALGSLLKDIGQLNAAIKMYEQAVACDGTFDIALANLANAAALSANSPSTVTVLRWSQLLSVTGSSDSF